MIGRLGSGSSKTGEGVPPLIEGGHKLLLRDRRRRNESPLLTIPEKKEEIQVSKIILQANDYSRDF